LGRRVLVGGGGDKRGIKCITYMYENVIMKPTVLYNMH
jgi:hypothetical protein